MTTCNNLKEKDLTVGRRYSKHLMQSVHAHSVLAPDHDCLQLHKLCHNNYVQYLDIIYLAKMFTQYK